jgi:hypothetical protein
MALFWLQTTIKNDHGFVRFTVDAPFETIDEFANALSDGEIIAMDKIWKSLDENDNKYISGRERIALGADYIGMIQMSRENIKKEME